MHCRVFHAAEHRRAGHIARHAHHENIPQALVKKQFHRFPRIGAGQHHGHRLLSIPGQVHTPHTILVRMLRFFLPKKQIAMLKLRKTLLIRQRRRAVRNRIAQGQILR